MITAIHTIIVTHDDSFADFYHKELTEDEGWVIKEDTFATSYTLTLRCHLKGKKYESRVDK